MLAGRDAWGPAAEVQGKVGGKMSNYYNTSDNEYNDPYNSSPKRKKMDSYEERSYAFYEQDVLRSKQIAIDTLRNELEGCEPIAILGFEKLRMLKPEESQQNLDVELSTNLNQARLNLNLIQIESDQQKARDQEKLKLFQPNS